MENPDTEVTIVKEGDNNLPPVLSTEEIKAEGKEKTLNTHILGYRPSDIHEILKTVRLSREDIGKIFHRSGNGLKLILSSAGFDEDLPNGMSLREYKELLIFHIATGRVLNSLNEDGTVRSSRKYRRQSSRLNVIDGLKSLSKLKGEFKYYSVLLSLQMDDLGDFANRKKIRILLRAIHEEKARRKEYSTIYSLYRKGCLNSVRLNLRVTLLDIYTVLDVFRYTINNHPKVSVSDVKKSIKAGKLAMAYWSKKLGIKIPIFDLSDPDSCAIATSLNLV